ncbi:MAG: hypothetical protein KKH33_08620, partial [Alphaproteobacteria bacterium]|nr:hypothetical protein [Alphaproteobacteria bacterium]
MSIEDPRLSMIDNTSAADEFASAVEQHLGFVRETEEGIEVAQAATPETGRTDRLPAEPPVETGGNTIPAELRPNEQNVVTLPTGIELDNLEFEVDGENLVLVLADGTEVVVLGGAANIPTFVIGDIELPQVALFAALEESDINVAAGPNGTFSAQGGSPGNSRNFVDNPIGGLNDELALADLLGDTDFEDEQQTATTDGATGGPSILSPLTASLIYDEAVLVGGPGSKVITGALPFEQGPNFGTITAVTFTGASNVDEGDGSTALAGFTSGGRPISIVTNGPSTSGSIVNFDAIQGFDSQGNLVFSFTIVDRTSGEFRFELFAKLEHPDVGESDLADLLRLGFTYTVTDLTGQTVTGSFNIDIQDDAPTIGTSTVGQVDEDDLPSGFDKFPEREVFVKDEGPSEGIFIGDDEPVAVFPTTSGSLGINWGADNGNAQVNGGLTGLVDDRGLAFTGATIAGLVAQNLSSDGIALQYVLSVDGTTLYAYKPSSDGGSELGPLRLEGGLRPPFFENVPGQIVFTVALSDLNSGSFDFTLYGNLDHRVVGTSPEAEEDLAINFQFTAQDSDGDRVSASFTVNVNDDSPVFDRAPNNAALDEEDIPGKELAAGVGNSGDSYADTPDANDLDGAGTGDRLDNNWDGGRTVDGSLNLDWGADDNRGFFDGPAARTLVLTAVGAGSAFETGAAVQIFQDGASTATALTHNGQAVKMWVSEDGDYVAGYVGDLTEGFPSQLVFTINLSDSGQGGSYSFTLYKNLDHAVTGTEDDLRIDFQVVATDTDGDTATAGFSIAINDDAPVIVNPESKSAEDEVVATGNKEDDGLSGVANGNLGIQWGSDNGNNGSGGLGDRSVSFVSEVVEIAGGLNGGFTSLGEPVRTAILEDGTLVAYTGEVVPTAATGDGASAVVFYVRLSDMDTGSYTFTLVKPLDHADDKTNSENSLDLTFSFKATDSDGDSVENSFKVTVVDDIPVANVVRSAVMDDEAQDLFPGNPGGVRGDVEPDVKMVSGEKGTLFSAGADGLGDIEVELPFFMVMGEAANGFAAPQYVTWGDGVRSQGGVTTFTATTGSGQASKVVAELVIRADGSYDFTLNAPVAHTASSTREDNTNLVFNYAVVDGDGDRASGRLVVSVNDDTPVANVVRSAVMDDEAQDLFPGNPGGVRGDV